MFGMDILLKLEFVLLVIVLIRGFYNIVSFRANYSQDVEDHICKRLNAKKDDLVLYRMETPLAPTANNQARRL